MGQTPDDQHAESTDPLSRLEGIEEVPLAEQVAVFDAIHAHLSSRLTSAEN
jgi:hypothetical protein